MNGGSGATNLATWLATNFPYLYGASAGTNNLTGKTNKDVAALFIKFGRQNMIALTHLADFFEQGLQVFLELMTLIFMHVLLPGQ